MIKVFDGWEIDNDGYSWVVRYNTGKVNVDKSGKETTVYTNIKYPVDIPSALVIIKEELLKKEITSHDMTLHEAAEYIKSLNKQFEDLVKETFDLRKYGYEE